MWSSPHYFFPVSRAVGLEHECGRPVPQAFASLAPLCPGSPPEARARAEKRALEARLCPVPQHEAASWARVPALLPELAVSSVLTAGGSCSVWRSRPAPLPELGLLGSAPWRQRPECCGSLPGTSMARVPRRTRRSTRGCRRGARPSGRSSACCWWRSRAAC